MAAFPWNGWQLCRGIGGRIGLEYATIIDDAQNEGVAALLHSALENTTLQPPLPAEFQAELKQNAQRAAAQELARRHELQQVLTLFVDQSITYLLIKGTPLANTIYPQPYHRTRSDTDIVFPDQQTAITAWHLLEQRGYHRPNAITGETISTQFACYRELRANISNTFDMHWRLNNSWRIADLFEFDELYERAKPVSQIHPHAQTPCAVDALIIACLHRIAHRPEQLHSRLIWLYDIHLILESLKNNEWDMVMSISRRKGIASALLDGMDSTIAHFNSEVPETIYKQLSSDETKQSINVNKFSSRWRKEIDQLRALPTMQLKLAHLKTNLFPDKDYLMKKYHVTHSMCIPWLYAKRIAAGIARRAK